MRRRIAALLILALVPLLAMVLVPARAGAQEPTISPSPVAAQDTPSRKTQDATPSPVDTATVTLTLSNPTPSAVPATTVPTETRVAPAEVSPLSSPMAVATASQTPMATATPPSVVGVLGSIAPFAYTNPAAPAVIGGACLSAAGVLLLAVLLRRRRLPAPAPRPLDPSIPVLEGITAPELKFYLDREQMTIGRASNCDFRIPERVSGTDAISRQHARFEKRGQRWAVIDGARDGELSTNGIFVNGKRTLENYLADDDEIGFGEMIFRFHAPPAITQLAEGNPR